LNLRSLTTLIAGNTTTAIPVSCVEQERWSYSSDRFSSEKRLMAGTLRAHKSAGQGSDCRLDSDQSAGFALTHENQVLHLSLFAKAAENKRDIPGARMIRFARRRHRRF
jgi:hypothetical protein